MSRRIFSALCLLWWVMMQAKGSLTEDDHDPRRPSHSLSSPLIIVSYNSYQRSSDKDDEQQQQQQSFLEASYPKTEAKLVQVGQGADLWVADDQSPERTRGWMYRFRQTMVALHHEYETNNHNDFVVTIADATDVYLPSPQALLDKFLRMNADIVFSAQIYCCNPWNLREIARRSWDAYHHESSSWNTTTQEAATFPDYYKHLNAGLFIGYASAILQMADQMQIFNTTYLSPDEWEEQHQDMNEHQHQDLSMADVLVDDDEWQISAWFLQQQQQKSTSGLRVHMDMEQDLFAVTGSFRVQQRGDDFLFFSRQDFHGMHGSSSSHAAPSSRLSLPPNCPYEYIQSDSGSGYWQNTLTDGQPLAFHFAGNDFSCACHILDEEEIPFAWQGKFATQCATIYPQWKEIIQRTTQELEGKDMDPSTQIYWKKGAHNDLEKIYISDTTNTERRIRKLANAYGRITKAPSIKKEKSSKAPSNSSKNPGSSKVPSSRSASSKVPRAASSKAPRAASSKVPTSEGGTTTKAPTPKKEKRKRILYNVNENS